MKVSSSDPDMSNVLRHGVLAVPPAFIFVTASDTNQRLQKELRFYYRRYEVHMAFCQIYSATLYINTVFHTHNLISFDKSSYH